MKRGIFTLWTSLDSSLYVWALLGNHARVLTHLAFNKLLLQRFDPNALAIGSTSGADLPNLYRRRRLGVSREKGVKKSSINNFFFFIHKIEKIFLYFTSWPNKNFLCRYFGFANYMWLPRHRIINQRGFFFFWTNKKSTRLNIYVTIWICQVHSNQIQIPIVQGQFNMWAVGRGMNKASKPIFGSWWLTLCPSSSSSSIYA